MSKELKELQEIIEGKSLKEIWESNEVKEWKKAVREKLQKVLNDWCTKDRKRHIPVYLSLKPKKKVLGRYFAKPRGNGSIVIYVLRIKNYPIEKPSDVKALSLQEIGLVLKHEYSHHLSRDYAHNEQFHKNFKKIEKRKVNI